MKVTIQIDDDCAEPEVVIRAAVLTEEVRQTAELLSSMGSASFLVGFQAGTARLLNPACIRRIYASSGKVFAVTDRGEWVLKLRLYEAEKRLAGRGFIRISHSEILNLKEVEKFDLNLSGSILVVLSDGSTAYVSRRYVRRVREALGV